VGAGWGSTGLAAFAAGEPFAAIGIVKVVLGGGSMTKKRYRLCYWEQGKWHLTSQYADTLEEARRLRDEWERRMEIPFRIYDGGSGIRFRWVD
jgi:hypothetical protein